MTIRVLPPQLANQIAAGEVVERPASVVKELVENSLDAGATRVDIEIDKGGAKLIKIQDNGNGIAKEELALALSRHATSKLSSIDDLEAILSFGFRGEALASISSVARLTLTSKTAEQAEAWLAYAEGSEMAVKVMPAAHPQGTTIEVADLFFNTPARRRFLKSDKTEFTHIDEWLKRIALARPEIHLTLKHNGKQVRNYRPATNESQYLQRLTQVCGRGFVEHALKVECEHDGLRLSGYLQSPMQTELVDAHYFYVNGRHVRDRLVTHAVKQAFAGLGELEQPGYILMLSVDPHQVDVNVHPAKHEVRFHEARFVHDFVLQALSSALEQCWSLPLVAEQAPIKSQLSQSTYDRRADEGGATSQREPRQLASEIDYETGEYRPAADPASERESYGSFNLSSAARQYGASSPSKAAVRSYGALITTPMAVHEAKVAQTHDVDSASMPPLLDGDYWVLVAEHQLSLLAVKQVASALTKLDIGLKLDKGLPMQPLLMPVAVEASTAAKTLLSSHNELLQQLGFSIDLRQRQLIIKKVPPYLRDTQLAQVVPALLEWLAQGEHSLTEIAEWMATKSVSGYISAPLIWQQFLQLDDAQRQQILKMAKALPWQQWVGNSV
ncbi:DNA mismatch repair endonuclease MutL [Shewanella avicenniae]|uniref:DNA mismatch repair protein MutL n=1 Tax=Shewanella avicenniae TaxID=2814294 RepID=A0ABX7QTL3_9GAMM|nr:DNA mismatch repair endonuclease MutL [Shewanella avicenniae]QSX34330.1 DNA mismatch repair endonuclease MutL [Shewanella avicenniae]